MRILLAEVSYKSGLRSKSTKLLLLFWGLPHLQGHFFPIPFVRIFHAQSRSGTSQLSLS
jgi:hypothetical protein